MSPMPTFNLIHQPWIPCQMAAGPPLELSLHDLFARAAEVRDIADPSPLSPAAIYRLVIAIAQRVLPHGEPAWETLWQARDIRTANILAYLDEWHHRFDLFDPARPFYQVAGLDPGLANTVAKLTHERNAGANAALFDHSLDASPEALTPAEAARALLATLAFAPGGLQTFEKGKPEDRSADGAPLVKAAVVVIGGENLSETILLNLFRIDPQQPFPHDPARDRPAWERDSATHPADRYPDGPLDLLTWQSRRVLLITEERDGRTLVPGAVVMKGFQFPSGFSLADSEPMAAFREVRKPTGTQEPKPPVGFRLDRAAWRDSLALLQSMAPDERSHGRHRPRSLDDLSNRLPGANDVRLHLYGLGVDRAKLLLWRHEQFRLPLAYLKDGDLVYALTLALGLAEDAGRTVNSATAELARKLLSPEGTPDPARVSALVDALAPGRAYWAALDPHYRCFLPALAGAWVAGRTEERRVRERWAADVRRAATDAFEVAAASAETNARGFRAAAEARGRFTAFLNRTLTEYQAQIPEEVPA